MNKNILSVTALTQSVKEILENRFSQVQVRGEVTNVRKQASGHIYFTLKDKNSQISAVLFRGHAQNISYQPKNGDEVTLKGDLSVYAPYGNYQIIVKNIELSGVGELLLKLHELKAEFKSKGWFDKEHKKPLPKYPRTIGVITSPTGSVIQDVLHVLKRRFEHFHLILGPVRVQGEGASDEIAEAIETFNTYKLADVLIVGRGGGSLEHLWPFNEKKVAQAIFHSKTPIISAVGHETDVSIADFVADIRAPTPSAAAEICVKKLSSQLQFLTQVKKQTSAHLMQNFKHHRMLLEGIKRQPYFSSPHLLLSESIQSIDEVTHQIDQNIQNNLVQKELQLQAFKKHLKGLEPSKQLLHLRCRLHSFNMRLQTSGIQTHTQLKKNLNTYMDSIRRSLSYTIQRKREHLNLSRFDQEVLSSLSQGIKMKRERLNRLKSHLLSIDPKNLLKKGYCIPFSEKEDLVMIKSSSFDKGDKLSLLFHDGKVKTTVDEVTLKTNDKSRR